MARSMFEVIGFVPPQLVGIDAELIESLFRIAETYGIQEQNVRYVCVPEQPLALVLLVSEAGSVLQVICPMQTNATLVSVAIRTEAALIPWDLRVTLEAAQKFVRLLHRLRDLGLVWPPRGERPTHQPRYFVDRVFRMRGATVPTDVEDIPPQMQVGLFDRPQEVALLKDTEGTFCFCRLADVPYFRRKNEITREILRARNLQSLSGLDAETVRSLTNQINARLLAEFPPEA